jgi:membrane protein
MATSAYMNTKKEHNKKSFVQRLDSYQRNHRWAGFPVAVVYKFLQDQGTNLAALIAHYGFLSLFPLLLLLSTILGIVLAGNPEAQRSILDSALSQFPVIGSDLQSPAKIGGGVVGLVIGGLGALYGAMGVANAVQTAMNTLWSVPKNERPGFLPGRARSLLLLVTAGVVVIGATVLSAINAGAGDFISSLGPWAQNITQVLLIIAGVIVNSFAFLLAFRIAVARDLSNRDVLPGAIAAGICWQLLQSFGALYVNHVVHGANATNGVFAVVLGLLGFIYLSAAVIVLCAETNVVRVQKLYPRALLAPFSDDAGPTSGDKRAYTNAVMAEQVKDFQDIDVSYDEENKK